VPTPPRDRLRRGHTLIALDTPLLFERVGEGHDLSVLWSWPSEPVRFARQSTVGAAQERQRVGDSRGVCERSEDVDCAQER
jgi:hypothetical protein